MDKLKIYALTTKSHETLLTDWFLKTMPADCEPIVHFMNAEPTIFRRGHWHKIFIKKLEMILNVIQNDKLVVISDVDIQFFRPMAVDLQNKMQGYDILFQNNACGRSTDMGDLCGGFLVVRCSAAVSRFFEATRRQLIEMSHPAIDDQVAYANIIGRFSELKFGLLPNTYWTNAAIWKPGETLSPPNDIVIHHANWVLGVDHKVKQLEEVRRIILQGT